MRKKLGCLLILLLSTVYLSGCIYLRPVGPCYGVGCSALTSGKVAQSGQPAQPGQAATAQASKAPDQKPTAKKGFFSRLLPKWAQPNQRN
jgi:hypothetical protein